MTGLRSCGAVLRHVAFWNEYVANCLQEADETSNELPVAKYARKADVLEALDRSSQEVAAALRDRRTSLDSKTLELVGTPARVPRITSDRNTNMASIRKEISTNASPADVWAALRDIGALHTRLVPGFVIDTRLEPGERIVTFGNGMVVREPIIDVDDDARRLVWSAIDGPLTHYNASAQVFANPDGQTRVVWIADLLPHEAAGQIGLMMEQGMAVMKATLDRLAE